MPIIVWDIETRSTLDLADTGAWKYAADPTTEVLVICYAVDDGPIETWIPGQAIPESFIIAARDPDWLIAAHNDQFERAIETRLLNPRYGWPLIPIERRRCTMAMALASALPASLEGAAAALGLPTQKDTEGRRLMLAMCKPRRPRKSEIPGGIYWHDGPEKRARLAQYCANDVAVERMVYQHVPPLSPEEQKLWQLDAEINARGFFVDLELAGAARLIVHAEQEAIDQELTELTGGRITGVNQVARLQAVIQEHGHQIAGLTKRSVAAVLAHQPSDEVRHLLELRREGSRAAPRKLESLIAGVNTDGRLRGTFQFHGAATGRWSGRKFQPQNLKKPETKDDPAIAIGAIHSGDLARVRELGAPLAIVGDLSRSMITAAPVYTLIGADFSAVESRVLAWIAGEIWKLDAYRKFDETNDPAFEPYCQTAGRILGRTVTPENQTDRAIGKTCDLAFGYGGGLGAFRRFDTSKAHSDIQVENFKIKWRAQHVMTVHFWRALENMLRRAMRTGERTTLRCLTAEFTGGNLYLTLPSGRRLTYPEAHLEPGKFGKNEIVFKDNARGGWADQRGWFGIFVENAVAGIARDLLAQAMLRVEASGYPIVLHVHDELVAEVPEGFGSVDAFVRLMTMLPDWAAGLPLVAKGWTNVRYGAKSQPAPALPRPPTVSPSPVPASLPVAPAISPAAPVLALNGHALAKPAISAIITKELVEFTHVPLPALIGEPLTNGKVCCPFHADRRPSLHVYDDHFHCYVCGAHGDHIDWLTIVEGIDRAAALRLLAAWDGPVCAPARADEDDGQTLAEALEIWNEAQPIGGSKLATRYLGEIRRLDLDALPKDDAALRFHPKCPIGTRGGKIPCIVACYRDVVADTFAGIHRILLTDDVLFFSGKARRYTLGKWPTPRAIKFWPAGNTLFLGEGVETTLAAATRFEYRDAPMLPAWAAGSGSNLSKFPVLPGVQKLVLLVDHDANGDGKKYANDCRQRWRAAKRDVVQLLPDREGADFNDILLGQAP